VFALGSLFSPAFAANDDALVRMALCKDSWADWQKSDPAKRHANDPYFLPDSRHT